MRRHVVKFGYVTASELWFNNSLMMTWTTRGMRTIPQSDDDMDDTRNEDNTTV